MLSHRPHTPKPRRNCNNKLAIPCRSSTVGVIIAIRSALAMIFYLCQVRPSCSTCPPATFTSREFGLAPQATRIPAPSRCSKSSQYITLCTQAICTYIGRAPGLCGVSVPSRLHARPTHQRQHAARHRQHRALFHGCGGRISRQRGTGKLVWRAVGDVQQPNLLL